jgi:small-conductance mechanosensitive channel
MTDTKYVLLSVAVAVAAILCGLAIHSVVTFFVKRRHARVPFSLRGMQLNLEHLRGPLRALVPAVCLAIVLPFLQFPANVAGLVSHTLGVWTIAAVAWLSIRMTAMARDVILSRYDITARDNLKARRVYTQLRVFERVLVIMIGVIAVAAILMTFRTVRQVGVSILASAGVIGLIVGFAAQRSIATILAGLQIAVTQPIRLGDAVVVEGEWGKIEEITLTYVVLRIWDDRRLVVPITYFIEKPFQNWTRTDAQLLAPVYIHADYQLPVEAVRQELRRIVAANPLWDGRVCRLQVTDARADSIQLRALASAADSSQAWNLRCEVREKLIEFLRENFPESLPRTRIDLERETTRNEDGAGRTLTSTASKGR